MKCTQDTGPQPPAMGVTCDLLSYLAVLAMCALRANSTITERFAVHVRQHVPHASDWPAATHL
jgi:hypothetical protein